MYSIEVKKRKNSRKYTPIKEFETEKEVINYMKENKITFAGTPYIFTHIMLSDDSIIKLNCMGMISSPSKLRDMLTGKEAEKC